MDPDLYAYPDVDRPWVRTNFVSTVDGSVQDERGVSGSLGGDVDHSVFMLLRSLCDVVLVGAGTVRAEGYRPVSSDDLDADIRGDQPPPVLALASLSLDVPETLRRPGVAVVTTTGADDTQVAALESAGVEVLRHGESEIDWSSALEAFDDRGWNRVLAEGGPTLHGALLAADVVDELCITIAPVAVAGTGLRIATSALTHRRDLVLDQAVEVDGVLLTRWLRDR